MRLIVTRPVEDCGPLTARLEALGHTAVAAPLLRIVPRAGAPVPDRPYRMVVFSSANAARALGAHPARPRLTALPALAVGPQSLAAARAAGFAEAGMAGGDVAGLARHIALNHEPAGGPLLYVSGAETAGDLTALLCDGGFEVDRVVLYDAIAATKLSIDLNGAAGVLLYSPRTAGIWARLAGPGAARLQHFCLSPNVVAALPPHWPARVAQAPREEALLALLDRA